MNVRPDFKFFLPTLLGLVLILAGKPLWAQNCTQTLKRAQLTYDEGRIAEVPGIIEACLKSGFNKEERATAYRLLTLTYLYLDEPAKADEAMLKLLRTNHEYQINTSVDPAEFINLYNKFRTNPIYRVGVKAGLNMMHVDVGLYKTTNSYEYAKEDLKIWSGVNFQVGSAAEIPVKGNLDLRLELLWAQKGYNFKYETAGFAASYQEKLSWIELPVMLKYNFNSKRYIPFINIGAEGQFMLTSYGNTYNGINSPTRSFVNQRWRIGAGLLAGVGLRNKVGPGILSIELRYCHGFTRLILDKERFAENGTFQFNYGVVVSQYEFRPYSVNLDYVIPIYNPKKLRK